jgi:hypothetical protein
VFTEDTTLFEQTDHFYIFRGSEQIRLIRRKFKEQMKELLSDDEGIVQQIDRGELDYDDPPTIICDYTFVTKKQELRSSDWSKEPRGVILVHFCRFAIHTIMLLW